MDWEATVAFSGCPATKLPMTKNQLQPDASPCTSDPYGIALSTRRRFARISFWIALLLNPVPLQSSSHFYVRLPFDVFSFLSFPTTIYLPFLPIYFKVLPLCLTHTETRSATIPANRTSAALLRLLSHNTVRPSSPHDKSQNHLNPE